MLLGQTAADVPSEAHNNRPRREQERGAILAEIVAAQVPSRMYT